MSKLWKQEDIIYLTENYAKLGIKEISKKLGRTSAAIRKKLSRMGLTENSEAPKKEKTKSKKVKSQPKKETVKKTAKEKLSYTLDDLKITGFNSGRIWNYLNKNPKSSIEDVAKGTNMPAKQLYLALGWLSREHKLYIVDNNKLTVK